eukprot:s1243_g3.t1
MVSSGVLPFLECIGIALLLAGCVGCVGGAFAVDDDEDDGVSCDTLIVPLIACCCGCCCFPLVFLDFGGFTVVGSSSSISRFSALGAFVLTFLAGVFLAVADFRLSAIIALVSIPSGSSGSASGGDTSVSIFACAGSLLVFFALGAFRTVWSFIAFLTGFVDDDEANAGVGDGGGGFGHDGGYCCDGVGCGADDALAGVGGANDMGCVLGWGGRLLADALGGLGGGGGFGGFGGLAGASSSSGIKVSVSFDAINPPIEPPLAVPVAVATALMMGLDDFKRFFTFVLLVDADACSSCACGSSLIPADAVAPTASYAPLFIL